MAATFLRDGSGNFATGIALVAPLLLGLVGGALDLLAYNNHESRLQAVADAAALAAVGESTLKGWSEASARAVAETEVDTRLGEGSGGATFTTIVKADLDRRRVDVIINQDNFGYFVASYFKSNPQISVRAVAEASGQTNVCVVGLDEAAEATIGLNSDAIMTAPNCSVYSNSRSTVGLESKSNSLLTAELSCSAGGYSGSARNYKGDVLSDCPPVEDPLIGRKPPDTTGACKFTGHKIVDKVATLSPGIYCGGLLIDGNADVRMNPGVYVFRDGPFTVNSNSIVNGTGVGLVFAGSSTGMEFKSNVEVNLEAPSDGEMAGLLVYQLRGSPESEFRIESNFTRNLLGTLYMPNGHFIVNANNKVADESAYTAIVARTVRLNASPNLVLNTDYGATTVPVPAGVGPRGGDVRLVR